MSSEALKAMKLKLGRKVDQGGLDPIPRSISRTQAPPPNNMRGRDLWNAYEVSFLQPNGVPRVFHMQASYSAETPNIIESKSFKLYLNGLNQQVFQDTAAFQEKVTQDTRSCVGGQVTLKLFAKDQSPSSQPLPGQCLDTLSPDQVPTSYSPDHLRTVSRSDSFCFNSQILRTLCPVTHQPDWGNVLICGKASKQPEPSALLAYLVSFRNHPDFHETCCETIFTDLYHLLEPDALQISCFYTRRGGLDINPLRILGTEEYPQIQTTWRQ